MSWDKQIDSITMWLNGWLAEDVESVALSLPGRGLSVFETWAAKDYESVQPVLVERALEGVDAELDKVKGVARLNDTARSIKQKTWKRPADDDEGMRANETSGPLAQAVAETIRHFKTEDERKASRIEYLEEQNERRVTETVAARTGFLEEAFEEARSWGKERQQILGAVLKEVVPRLATILDKAMDRYGQDEETIEICDENGDVIRTETRRRA